MAQLMPKKSDGLNKFRQIILVASLSLSAFMCGQRLDAQQVAIHFNTLKLSLMTPDIGVDIVVGEKSSVGASISGHWHPYGFNSKILSVQPQFRYWFSGRPFNREYIGASAIIATYDITTSSRVYRGTAEGLGLTGGYVMLLGKRCALEISGGLSLLYYNQKRYSSSDKFSGNYEGADDWSASKGLELIPSNIGVTFIYIIK